MPTILAVLFDMDHVLCDLVEARRLAEYSRLTGHPPEFVREAIWGSGLDLRSDLGELSATEFIEEAGRRLGYPLTARQWAEARRCGMPPNHDVLELVIRLTVPKAVLTNNGLVLKEQIHVAFPEVAALFVGRFFTSAEFRRFKPDPEVYLRCCEAARFPPADTLFVDDREENVRGAEQAGLMGHRFVSAAELARVLSPVLA